MAFVVNATACDGNDSHNERSAHGTKADQREEMVGILKRTPRAREVLRKDDSFARECVKNMCLLRLSGAI